VLLATDGSEDAALAARAAADLAARSAAELHLVHVGVLPTWMEPDTPAAPRFRSLKREASALLEGEAERLAARGTKVTAVHLKVGVRADEEIVRLGEELGADLIVLGRRGLGTIGRLVAGSVSEGVARRARSPVLVVRGEGAWPPRRIVVGDDSSEEARGAAELAVEVARLFGAGLVLVRAYPVFLPPYEAVKAREEAALPLKESLRRHEARLQARATRLQQRLGRWPMVVVKEGEAASVLLDVAGSEGGAPDLIAVGRRGLKPFDRLMLGSVSADVLKAAEGPILVVPYPDLRRKDDDGRTASGLPTYSRLLVAVDGSPASLRAGRHAVSLAKGLGAKLFVLGVTGAGLGSEEAADDVADLAREAGVPHETVVAGGGRANRPVWEAAEELGADLLVVAQPRGSVGYFLGRAARPVLVVGEEELAPKVE